MNARSLLRRSALTLAVISAVALAACAGTVDKVSKFNSSPAGKKTGQFLVAAAGAGIQAVADQYTTSGKVNGAAIGVAALQGGILSLRSTEGTPAAASPLAVSQALTAGSGSSALSANVAPAVSAAVATAIAKGVPPSQAVEAAALFLDHAAATAKPAPKG